MDAVIRESGERGTGVGMDPYRASFHGWSTVVCADFMCSVGLEAQAALLLRKLGLHAWPSDCISRLVDTKAASPFFINQAPGDPGGVRTHVTFSILACFGCCAQSDPSLKRMRSLLRGPDARHGMLKLVRVVARARC